jgi:NAD(P)-dependent dehydrogenase (short-subunit alcohol dehydrogenase family)
MVADVPFPLPPAELAGRVAVVTGASRGLGAGMAARFAEHGLRLGLCARTVPEVPGGADPASVIARPVDVADAAAVDAFAGEVAGALGPIDLWVNNAGVLEPMGPQRDHDPSAVELALRVNVGGVMNGCRTLARGARSWPPARRVLVNISSGAARSVYEGWSVYGATKAAVEHYTEIVAAEEPAVVCRAIAPGVVDTDMQALIRDQDEATFPAVERFRELHRSDGWNSPSWVADHLLGVLAGTWGGDDVVLRVPDEPRR